ncbi:hypothetical protein WJX81_007399 [Elliptochloris bilobata]|uniref:Kri1-like C-terminal domain-containing protein n=1 Tax=Elliptochloris bilobata TaxID=381761 RepID=A0AAW1S8G8_9CHLO
MGKGLLDDDGEVGNEDLTLKVNSKYAARLEHNKRREELHRLQDKHPEVAARLAAGGGEVEESSSEDDEDDGLEQPQEEARFLDVLAKLKTRDSALYAGSATLFPEASDSDGDAGDALAPHAKRQKVMSLATVNAQQALAGNADSSDEDGGPCAAGGSPTYVQEQEALRRGFLEEADKALTAEEAGDSAFGGVLKPRRGGGRAPEAARQGPAKGEDARTQELLDAYFGTDEQLPEGERFLKSFIRDRGWVEKDGRGVGEEDGESEDADLDEDEEYITRAERFEANYNFRFQEPGGGNIVSYARQVEGVVRKADDRRTRARESKAARLAAEAAARQEDVRRLKAIKRREIEERLVEVQEAAGATAGDAALARMLESGGFDAAEYDRAMSAAFGDDYYEAEDEYMHETGDGGADEAEIAGAVPLPDANRAAAPQPSWAALHDEVMREAGAGVHLEDGAGEATGAKGGDLGGKQQSRQRRSVAALMEEYERLDAEDHVAGVACRFRYREVPAEDFGLRTQDLLLLPDKELNQVVGLRTLAPYREYGGRRARPNYGKLHQLQAEAVSGGEAAGSGQGQGGSDKAASAPKEKTKMKELSAQPSGVGFQQQGKDAAVDAAAARLQTFARPALRRAAPDSAGRKKRKHADGKRQQQAQAPAHENGAPAGGGLTKAQRKNLKRQQKRAQRREGKP